MSLTPAFAWALRGHTRGTAGSRVTGLSWGTRWGRRRRLGLAGQRRKGAEGESGLERPAAVAVVWASQTLLGDCGWGSGLRQLATGSEWQGWDLGFRGAVFGLGVPRPFSGDKGDTLLIPPSQG